MKQGSILAAYPVTFPGIRDGYRPNGALPEGRLDVVPAWEVLETGSVFDAITPSH